MAHFYGVAMAGSVRAMSGPAPALKIALFGTPSHFTMRVLRQLAEPGIVAAVVLAQRPGGVRDAMMRFAGITRISPLERAAQERRIPVIAATASNDSPWWIVCSLFGQTSSVSPCFRGGFRGRSPL